MQLIIYFFQIMSNEPNLKTSPPGKPVCVPTPGYWSTLHHPYPPTDTQSSPKGCESDWPEPQVLRLRGGGPTTEKGPCCQKDCPLYIHTLCEICGHNVCLVDWVIIGGKQVCEHCIDIPEVPAAHHTVQSEGEVYKEGANREGPDSYIDLDVGTEDDSALEPHQQENALQLALLSTFGHSEFRSKEQEEAVRCVLGREQDVFVSMPTGKTLEFNWPRGLKCLLLTLMGD